MRILIVDDNFEISETIADYFELRNVDVDFAYNGQEALNLLKQEGFDVVVMDVMMPKMDGISAVRSIRGELRLSIPIIYLSAKDKLEDKLVGFESGADDYLSKPFSLEELYVRVVALYNRSNKRVGGNLEFNGIEINTEDQRVTCEGSQLKLPPIQYKILLLLLQKAPALVSKQAVIDEVWGDDEPTSDALRSHMYALRTALNQGRDESKLETVYRKGFKLV